MKELLKHKKLIITLGIVAVLIITVIVLLFTLFSVQQIEVDFLNEPKIVFVSEESKQEVIESSGIKKGGTILGVNKKEIIKTLEKDNHYLKVVNIETVFPNKIVIHCAEREELFAVKAGDTKYFICDGEFKVLSVLGSFTNSQSNAILFKGLESSIQNSNRVNAGDFLEFEYEDAMLSSIAECLNLNNKTVVEQRALIKSITLDSSIYYYTARNQPFLQITDYNDFVTKVYVPESKLANKLQIMFAVTSNVVYNINKSLTEEERSALSELSEVERVTYYLNYNLLIEENNSGELLVTLKKIA